MNRSRVFFFIAIGLLACALGGSAAAQRKHAGAIRSTVASRQELDSLTAEVLQSPPAGATPRNGSASTLLSSTTGVQPERAPRENTGQNSGIPDQPDPSAATSARGLKRKLLRLGKSKAVWQAATGLLSLQNSQIAQGIAQYSGQSSWQGLLAQAAATLGVECLDSRPPSRLR
jgi:hypothetical protein